MSAAPWPPEHLATEANCLFICRRAHEAFSVRGPDRKSWLNGLLTNDVSRVKPGIAGWGLALTKQGKIQSELWLIEQADELIVFTPPGQASALVELLDRFLIMEDAELGLAPEQRLVVLIGPSAVQCARSSGAAWGEFDAMGFGGALVAVGEAALGDLQGYLRQAGAAPIEDAVWSALRVTRFLPEWGVDYSVESNPHEAGIAHRAQGQGPVDWDKGCYLGQEVVCMQDMRGKVRRSLFPLLIEGDDLPAADADVTDGADQGVGQLRSTVRSMASGGVLSFAFLKSTAAQGTLKVDGRTAKLVASA